MVNNAPSVYDIPSVYETAGGGIIAQLPDAAINGKLFKYLLPIYSFNNGLLIDDNLVLKRSISNTDPFILFQGNNFTLSNDDIFDIKFTVRKNSFSGNYNTVFGSVNNFYNNITLDFGNVNDSKKSVFFGVPRSDYPSSWGTPLFINDLSLTQNKWYSVKVVADNSRITLYVEDDIEEKSAFVLKQNLRANSPLQLMGINRAANNAFNGEIDLKNCYIKKNGVLLWGID